MTETMDNSSNDGVPPVLAPPPPGKGAPRRRRRLLIAAALALALVLALLLAVLLHGRGGGGGFGSGTGTGRSGQGGGTGPAGTPGAVASGQPASGGQAGTTGKASGGGGSQVKPLPGASGAAAAPAPGPAGAGAGPQVTPAAGAVAQPGSTPATGTAQQPGSEVAVTSGGGQPGGTNPEPVPVLFARVDNPTHENSADALLNPERKPLLPLPLTGTAGTYGPRGDAAAALRAGGSKGSEDAVELGLKWLAGIQAADGHWEGQYPVGNTGLATLAFLGAGHTHKAMRDKYRGNVERALHWLAARVQAPERGDTKVLGARDGQPGARKTGPQTTTGPAPASPVSSIISLTQGGGVPVDGFGRFQQLVFYEQGLGTMALCEAYGMTADPQLKDKAQLALEYIVACIGRGGGFGYSGPGNDVHVTSAQVMALKSGRLAKLEVPDAVFARLRYFYDSALNANGTTGYTSGPEPGKPESARTAVGLFCRLFLDCKPKDPAVQTIAAVVVNAGPRVEDVFQTYYGTYGMFQMGGDYWRAWNEAFRDPVIELQLKTGAAAGSWPGAPRCPDSVVSTALYIMALEVYYRYLPVNSLKSTTP